jgi:hypothetical protein
VSAPALAGVVTESWPRDDTTLALSDTLERVAVFGGVYNNHLALAATIADARARGAERLLCLGDLGGFGPHPERTIDLLRREGVIVQRGNYDHALALGHTDCGCGYTDPRDNAFAQVSYDYTRRRTSPKSRRWMATLPWNVRFTLGTARVLTCHGSPRRMNEFLWDSTTPDGFLRVLLDRCAADVILCTHTGRIVAKVGAIGRPANDGTTHVSYAVVSAGADGVRVEHAAVAYDHERLAREMREESLPEEFVETILTGWWTTCLEVLPAKERMVGKW